MDLVVEAVAGATTGRALLGTQEFPCALGRSGIFREKQEGDGATPVEAQYWFVRRNRGKRIELPLTAEVEQTYARTLAVLVRSIAGGLFPPKAPEAPDYAFVQCPYCNPDSVGHVENRERWERKRSDPALRELTELIDPDAAVTE